MDLLEGNHELKEIQKLEGHTDRVQNLACNSFYACFLQIPFTLGHSQDVKMAQWHPFLDMLVTCHYDNTIEIWAEEDDDTSNGHSSTVWALSFNSTGDRMVTCSDDLFVKNEEVDGASYKLLLKKEKAHEMGCKLNAVQWSSHETKLLASARDDGSIKIWELASVA
ncbi:hypothetical protein MKW94_019499 [Papaver nudicaule]|uniref:Cytosolic iron-sulfur protein assembly protein CIAO1 homolog n=1 Tax=Papaver nudicaule TaxID=74823 RepID=A0AA41RVI9_PAPNU|nr:hypothetical protein [Papaver nudicaule]